MSAFWSLSFSLVYIAVSTSNDGNCGERTSIRKSCCANFYKDNVTDQCLPCLGSFGINSNFPCPSGHYGHGCRHRCNCYSDEECDAKKGCLPRNNQSTAVYGQQNERLSRHTSGPLNCSRPAQYISYNYLKCINPNSLEYSCINYDQNCCMACTDGSGCHQAWIVMSLRIVTSTPIAMVFSN